MTASESPPAALTTAVPRGRDPQKLRGAVT
jgi:hypothetical protein